MFNHQAENKYVLFNHHIHLMLFYCFVYIYIYIFENVLATHEPFLKSETEIQENTGEAQCVSGHKSCDSPCDSLPNQMSNGCMTELILYLHS